MALRTVATRLFVLSFLAVTGCALRVPRVASRPASQSRTLSPIACAPPEDLDAAPEPPKPKRYSERDDLEDFFGINATTPVGALTATALVCGGWLTLVETIKLIDPNPAKPSIFLQFFN
jgi:hypothetical protein